jgi:hypothetical protein
MNKRPFITLLGGAAVAWPLAARAQTAPSMRRIGVLTALAEKDLGWQRNFAGFVAGLREKGWLEAQAPAEKQYIIRTFPGAFVDLSPERASSRQKIPVPIGNLIRLANSRESGDARSR